MQNNIKKILNIFEAKEELFIISYPKCGRGWLKFMYLKAFEQHFRLKNLNVPEINPTQLSRKLPIPIIIPTHDGDPHRKTPENVETSKHKYKNAKVIFLVRDPRDVLVSLYFHITKRSYYYHKSIHEFVFESVGGFDTILRFYNIWAENFCITKDYHIVRYEDLKADPHQELRRVLHFIGIKDVQENTIKKAVEFASFENMRNMEITNTSPKSKLKPGDKNDPESYKTRRGKVGGYTDYLSSEEIEYLNQKMKTSLSDIYNYKV